MKNTKRAEYVARDRILKLLSDHEIARISIAEESPRVTDGEEYLDLEQIGAGVQRGRETPIPVGRILARNAVHEHTWEKVLAVLSTNDLSEDASPAANAVSQSQGDVPQTAALSL